MNVRVCNHCKKNNITVYGVPTSMQIAEIAKSVNIPLVASDKIDTVFDGADQIDSHGYLIRVGICCPSNLCICHKMHIPQTIAFGTPYTVMFIDTPRCKHTQTRIRARILSSATKRGNSKANSSHNTSKSNSGSDSRTRRRFGRYIGS